MPRNDGVRMGAGGAVIQEIVEEPKPEKTNQSPKAEETEADEAEVQVLEERLVEMPSEIESEEE